MDAAQWKQEAVARIRSRCVAERWIDPGYKYTREAIAAQRQEKTNAWRDLMDFSKPDPGIAAGRESHMADAAAYAAEVANPAILMPMTRLQLIEQAGDMAVTIEQQNKAAILAANRLFVTRQKLADAKRQIERQNRLNDNQKIMIDGLAGSLRELVGVTRAQEIFEYYSGLYNNTAEPGTPLQDRIQKLEQDNANLRNACKQFKAEYLLAVAQRDTLRSAYRDARAEAMRGHTSTLHRGVE